MKEKIYAIVDLETTGGRASRDKITEIGIVLHDGRQIVRTYETLVNPECPIPYGITQLTGITQEMVQDAPRFFEVAKEIVELTEGAVFVAHNVRFDYSFLREEFKRLGYTYSRKTLCTVRLSRKTFPGLPSYSLENLIRHFGIQVSDRHRAMADTLATTELFERILRSEESQEAIHKIVNLGIREALLPRSLSIERIHEIPDDCGVYYFHNQAGDVIYVGKSKNIQKRVAEHFAQKTQKADKLQQHVHDLSYELTGSELIALLLESHEIKRLRPAINRAQRLRSFPFLIHWYENTDGYLCLEATRSTAKNRKNLNLVSEYPRIANARAHLQTMVREFELCPKCCHLEPTGGGPCFSYHLKQCLGACAGKESAEAYNGRVQQAIERLSTVLDGSFLILDEGRESGERAVIRVEEGSYTGFGYLHESESDGSVQSWYDAVKTYPGNPETNRIIRRHLQQNKDLRVISL